MTALADLSITKTISPEPAVAGAPAHLHGDGHQRRPVGRPGVQMVDTSYPAWASCRRTRRSAPAPSPASTWPARRHRPGKLGMTITVGTTVSPSATGSLANTAR